MTTAASRTLRTLGNSDMQLTSIGFGAWAIGGGDWAYAWGPQDDKESVAAIRRALDLGVNWIDTAAVYGLGHSEEVVAQALKGSGHTPYVFTKCSLRWGADKKIYNSLRAASVAEELEASLRRLNVESIDLYQVHWPNPENEIEEGWEALARLRQQGKVRWIGVSNFNVQQIERVAKIAPVTSLQPPYSMLRPAVQAEINYSPMLSGMLTGKMTPERIAAMPADDWRRNNIEYKEPRLGRNMRLVELLREIGSGHGVTPGVVAVAWTLHNPAITAAIVGGRSPHQVEETAAALEYRLSEEEYGRINGFLAANPA